MTHYAAGALSTGVGMNWKSTVRKVDLHKDLAVYLLLGKCHSFYISQKEHDSQLMLQY